MINRPLNIWSENCNKFGIVMKNIHRMGYDFERKCLAGSIF